MKKYKLHIVLLCIVLLFQCISVPAFASQTEESTATQETTEPPIFGTACITNGCRTIEGMVPLSGNERRLESAQGVFVFDTKTKTVVYSYNPDLKLSPGNLTKLVTALVVLDS